MHTVIHTIKALVPKRLYARLQPLYHAALASLGTLRFGFPSRKLYVIGVTGTKGKSTTTELITAILEEAGQRVALSNSIRFKVEDTSEPNLYKMSMPGRFFLQRFLRRAVASHCTYAVIEMTSEGAKLWRHLGISLDAFVFTNLSPEHIESHGSFEAYRDCKLRIRNALVRSNKPSRVIVSNKDDAYGVLFAEAPEDVQARMYSLKQAEPYALNDRGILFTYEGVSIHSPLVGKFNLYNMLAAATLARHLGIPIEVVKRALEKTSLIKGRVEKIDEGQNFTVIVDYAHTKDSLEKLYQAFPNEQKLCVLGNCGGGRDRWKRPEMAQVAEEHCREVVLTNEDPYDEDPRAIVDEMAAGMHEKKPVIIMDRREAIRYAFSKAQPRDVVLITGKGTDPYIMGPKGAQEPWSDAEVAREELRARVTHNTTKNE